MKEQDRAWRLFAEVAKNRDRRRMRTVTPLLGAGFNAQATRAKTWLDLLREVAREVGSRRALAALEMSSGAGSMTMLWEAMLGELAARQDKRVHEVEDVLRTIVAKLLRSFYASDGLGAPFVRWFLDRRFADVLSFNFDSTLLAEETTWHVIPGRPNPVTMHAVLPSGTRVWFPHGHERWPKSIRLGIRSYGTYIEDLDGAVRRYKTVERQSAGDRTRDRDQFRRAARRDASTWVDVALNADLLFLGLSMGTDEWPLWWFLTQRARNHARLASGAPRTFVLADPKLAQNLRMCEHLAGLSLLRCKSWPEGWEKLQIILEGA